MELTSFQRAEMAWETLIRGPTPIEAAPAVLQLSDFSEAEASWERFSKPAPETTPTSSIEAVRLKISASWPGVKDSLTHAEKCLREQILRLENQRPFSPPPAIRVDLSIAWKGTEKVWKRYFAEKPLLPSRPVKFDLTTTTPKLEDMWEQFTTEPALPEVPALVLEFEEEWEEAEKAWEDLEDLLYAEPAPFSPPSARRLHFNDFWRGAEKTFSKVIETFARNTRPIRPSSAELLELELQDFRSADAAWDKLFGAKPSRKKSVITSFKLQISDFSKAEAAYLKGFVPEEKPSMFSDEWPVWAVPSLKLPENEDEEFASAPYNRNYMRRKVRRSRKKPLNRFLQKKAAYLWPTHKANAKLTDLAADHKVFPCMIVGRWTIKKVKEEGVETQIRYGKPKRVWVERLIPNYFQRDWCECWDLAEGDIAKAREFFAQQTRWVNPEIPPRSYQTWLATCEWKGRGLELELTDVPRRPRWLSESEFSARMNSDFARLLAAEYNTSNLPGNPDLRGKFR